MIPTSFKKHAVGFGDVQQDPTIEITLGITD